MDPSATAAPQTLGAQLERLEGMLLLLEQSISALDAVASGELGNPWHVVAAATRTRDVLLARDAASGTLDADELRTLRLEMAERMERAR